jgi:hypothetical protein
MVSSQAQRCTHSVDLVVFALIAFSQGLSGKKRRWIKYLTQSRGQKLLLLVVTYCCVSH